MHATDFVTFADFIDNLSPEAKGSLALVCKVATPTTYVWAHRNAIERKYWPDLMANYPALTLPKLMAMEAASKAVAK